MNKLVQVALCVVFAAAVSAKPGYLGLGAPYAGHVAALAAVEHSGAYIHDPSGDHAVPYIHDPSGDIDLHSARVVAAVHPYAAAVPAAVSVAHHVPYAAALPYAAGIHGVHAAGIHGVHAAALPYAAGIHGVHAAAIHGVHAAIPAPVVDTPAVVAARAAHLAAKAAAHAHLG